MAGVRVAAVGPAAAAAFPGATEAYTGEVTGSVAVDVARLAFPDATRVGVARADAFPDGLAGGAMLGSFRAGLMLLVSADAIPAEVTSYLTDRSDQIETLLLFGGEASIGATVAEQLRTIVDASSG